MPMVKVPLFVTAAPASLLISPFNRVRVLLLMIEPLSFKVLRSRVMFFVLVNSSSASATREIVSPLLASASAAVMER